jgi:hypothetical protein
VTNDEQISEADELIKRSRTQAKNAAKNAARAAKATTEPIVDATAEEIRDTVDKLEDTADDAMQAARRINPRVLTRMSSDMGIGFFALSVSLYAAGLAVGKFRGAYADRNQVLDSRSK